MRKRRWRMFQLTQVRAGQCAHFENLIKRRKSLLLLPGETAQQGRRDGRVQRIARGIEPAEIRLHESRALLFRQEQIEYSRSAAQTGASNPSACEEIVAFRKARACSASPRKRLQCANSSA